MKAGSFELGSVEGGFFEEAGEMFARHLREWGEAEAGASECLAQTRAAKGGVDLGWGEGDSGNVAVVLGASEVGGAGVIEDDVEDDVVKVWVFAVSVKVPVLSVEVELNGAFMGFAIDGDDGVEEVRPRAAVPLTGGDDVDVLAVVGLELARKMSGKPVGLNFDFVGAQWGMVTLFS